MLAYFTTGERGLSDRLLAELSEDLRARGLRLAGAVQINVERPESHRCDMDLHVLTGTDVVRISQNLGRESRGCRLDPGGLERAVGLVAAALDDGPDLLIVNKFGKQEAEGRGFRPLIGEALARDVPVLTAVSAPNRAAFVEFCEGFAEELPPDLVALTAWVDGFAPPGRRASAG